MLSNLFWFTRVSYVLLSSLNSGLEGGMWSRYAGKLGVALDGCLTPYFFHTSSSYHYQTDTPLVEFYDVIFLEGKEIAMFRLTSSDVCARTARMSRSLPFYFL
ncbi:hypothetical protein F5141DRAFT_1095777 [Pisolithus sp. B1]|nr:hypothetical protein F5141DRAFT_1095777 [Pisolithus sp. B1]